MGLSEREALSMVGHEEVHREIERELKQINSKLAPAEQIKRYTLLLSEFSVDSGEFTPTMKVKRKFVNQKYQAEINKMYQ